MNDIEQIATKVGQWVNLRRRLASREN